MRRFILFLLVSITCINSKAQTVAEVEDNFAQIIERISYWVGNTEDENRYDSLHVLNKQAVEYLVKSCNEVPATITAKFSRFDSLMRAGVITSDDGKVRVYEWDDYQGGTMRAYNSVIQYKSGDSVFATELCTDIRQSDPPKFCPSYNSLYSFKTSQQGTVYVIVKLSLYSSSMGAEEIVAFKLDGKSLKWDIPFFKTKERQLTSIGFEFERFKTKDTSYGSACFIEWDIDKNVFYVPIIDNNNYITGKYFRYKFDGDYFIYDKIVRLEDIKERIR